jgi:AcrR family transcriptional regulator
MRERLLTAAMDLFAERGYDETTIDQIAERADVARQTVLNHYPHKRDFPLTWGKQRRDRLLELADSGTPDEPVRERLRRYFAALAAMNEDERVLTRSLYASQSASDLREQVRPVPDAVLAAIRDGQRSGELATHVDPAEAAEVITAVYFDTLTRWLVAPEPEFDLSAALRRRLDLVLTGLNTR